MTRRSFSVAPSPANPRLVLESVTSSMVNVTNNVVPSSPIWNGPTSWFRPSATEFARSWIVLNVGSVVSKSASTEVMISSSLLSTPITLERPPWNSGGSTLLICSVRERILRSRSSSSCAFTFR